MMRERISQNREFGKRLAIKTGLTLALLVVCLLSSMLCMRLALDRIKNFNELAFGGGEQMEDPVETKLSTIAESELEKNKHEEIIINMLNDGTVVLDQKAYKLNELLPVLTEKKNTFQRIKVIVSGKGDVPHDSIIGVMNVCASAGIWDISFSTSANTFADKSSVEFHANDSDDGNPVILVVPKKDRKQ